MADIVDANKMDTNKIDTNKAESADKGANTAPAGITTSLWKGKVIPAPTPWYGGKQRLVKFIVPELVKIRHRIFVDVFGGTGAIIINKPPVDIEVYNDIDGGLVNFFRVIADPEKFEAFYRRVAVLPYSRRLHSEFRECWSKQDDEVERAVMWYYVARQSFSGVFSHGGWCHNVTTSRRGIAAVVSRWLSSIELLPEIHQRLQRVQIENLDWRKCLYEYDTPETLFYLDPPYVPDTRAEKKVYTHEMSVEDHAELVQKLLGLRGSWVLSGYRHEVYRPLEQAGAVLLQWERPCWAAGDRQRSIEKRRGLGEKYDKDTPVVRRGRRVECLWIWDRWKNSSPRQLSIEDELNLNELSIDNGLDFGEAAKGGDARLE